MYSAKRMLAAAAAVTLLAAATGARAESASAAVSDPAAGAAVDAMLTEKVADAPAGPPATEAEQRMSPEDMAGVSAGADTITATALSNQQLTATTSGNSITVGTLNSGAVSFDANALSGFNGIGNFLVNTGANSTIQGGINISIVTTPGAGAP